MVPERYTNAEGKYYRDSVIIGGIFVHLKIFSHGSLLFSSGGLHFWSTSNTDWVLAEVIDPVERLEWVQVCVKYGLPSGSHRTNEACPMNSLECV